VTHALLACSALAASLAALPVAELSLPDALGELDRQAPGLAQARARADEAASLSRQAAASLLPTLSASGGYTRNSADAVIDLSRLGAALPAGVAAGLPGPIAIQPLETFSGTLALRVPLVIPVAWYETAAARDGARGAAAQAEAARLSLRAVLAATAHLARAAEEAVEATERAVASAARLAESADRKLRAGTAAPLDLLRAQTEQVRRQGDLVRARADLEKTRLAAGTLLGRDAPVRILVDSTAEWAGSPTPAGAPGPAPPPGPAEEGLVAEALSHRAELVAAQALVRSAEAQVGSAWARLAPQLSATGAVFAADVAYPTGQKDGWRLTLDLTWPLYDGGFRYGKRREAQARLAGAQAAALAQRLAVGQEARDTARDEAVALERLHLAEEQRRLAEQAAGTAQRGFEAGVASSLDVIDTNDRLYLADIGLAEARARLAGTRIALRRALGRGP
jgi:outer membrane protein TolC